MKLSARWIPALIAPVVVAGAVALPSVASAASAPPARTPQEVLALIASSATATYSGTVQETTSLGLPQLPSGTGVPTPSASGSAASLTSMLGLLTAPHTAKVYVGGKDQQRVQLLDSLAERDVVRNGTDVWIYDSAQKTATRYSATAGGTGHAGGTTASPDPSPTATAMTPSALADKLVAAISPTTTLAVGTGSVAGRSVYQLSLTPSSGGTLVSQAVLSVDAATGVPLQVEIDAAGQTTPAVSVGFSAIDFQTPAASVFAFTPPAGTTVTDGTATKPGSGSATPSPTAPGAATKPTTVGAGWSTIVELPAAAGAAALPTTGTGSALDSLLTPVTGGRALQTSLVTVLITDDGRVLAGAVPLSALQAAAK